MVVGYAIREMVMFENRVFWECHVILCIGEVHFLHTCVMKHFGVPIIVEFVKALQMLLCTGCTNFLWWLNFRLVIPRMKLMFAGGQLGGC